MYDFENAILNFLATLGGVFIAFGLGLLADRERRRADERDTRKRIAKAIQIELEANLKIIKDNREKYSKEQKQQAPILFPSSAYQSAIGGGFLSLFESGLQYSLGSIYTSLKSVELLSARIVSMMGSTDMSMPNFQENFRAFQTLIDYQLKELEEVIPRLLQGVKSEQNKKRKNEESVPLDLDKGFLRLRI